MRTIESGTYWLALVLFVACVSNAIATQTTPPAPGPVTSACHVSPIVANLTNRRTSIATLSASIWSHARNRTAAVGHKSGTSESSRTAESTPSLYRCTHAERVLWR